MRFLEVKKVIGRGFESGLRVASGEGESFEERAWVITG